MQNTAQYKEGEVAHGSGQSLRDNPYKIGSNEHWLWQEGFMGNDKNENMARILGSNSKG